MLSPTVHQGEKEGHKWGTEQGRQELYGALTQGLRGLQKTLRDGEEVQRARTTRCLQLLAQEIRDRWVLAGEQLGSFQKEWRPGRKKWKRPGVIETGGEGGKLRGQDRDGRLSKRVWGRLGDQKEGKTGSWR